MILEKFSSEGKDENLGFWVRGLLLASSLTLAAGPKNQVTGPVLEVRDDSITVQKGKEKWELARDKNTKVSGDLKVGSKVTGYYEMRASAIEAKEAGKAASKATGAAAKADSGRQGKMK